MRDVGRAVPGIALIALLLGVAVAGANQDTVEDRVREIAAELRCPVCQNLSVADSPSTMAQEMRGVIRAKLQEGKTPDDIKAYFLEKYGDWILLSPRPRGLSLLVWIGPFVGAAVGLCLAGLAIRRWARRGRSAPATSVAPAILERVRREALEEEVGPAPEGEGGRSPLERERTRLYAALREIDFDYHAGKLSSEDHGLMRQEYEARAAAVVASFEAEQAGAATAARAPAPDTRPAPARARETVARRPRPWRTAVAAVLLLGFGSAIGVSLTLSLRPRMSDQDSITGDFLTGTGPLGVSPGGGMRGMPGMQGAPAAPAGDLQAVLAAGEAAFNRQEWGTAIQAYRRAVELDPDNPVAHTHLGLILVQGGHVDPALAAFERALARSPRDPVALWAKGWALVDGRQDYQAAIRTWEQLLAVDLIAADAERVRSAIAEARTKLAAAPATERGSAVRSRPQISGTVSVAPSLAGKVPIGATLFVIARKGAAGPPLAATRVTNPVFPLTFALGPDDVMLRGTPFEGDVTLTARLKRDGSAGPAVTGDLEGTARAPIRIGQTGVEIVLDVLR